MKRIAALVTAGIFSCSLSSAGLAQREVSPPAPGGPPLAEEQAAPAPTKAPEAQAAPTKAKSAKKKPQTAKANKNGKACKVKGKAKNKIMAKKPKTNGSAKNNKKVKKVSKKTRVDNSIS